MTEHTDHDGGTEQDTARTLERLLGCAPMPWQVVLTRAVQRGDTIELTRVGAARLRAHHGREGNAFGSPLPRE
jgi:hypothetical protein